MFQSLEDTMVTHGKYGALKQNLDVTSMGTPWG